MRTLLLSVCGLTMFATGIIAGETRSVSLAATAPQYKAFNSNQILPAPQPNVGGLSPAQLNRLNPQCLSKGICQQEFVSFLTRERTEGVL